MWINIYIYYQIIYLILPICDLKVISTYDYIIWNLYHVILCNIYIYICTSYIWCTSCICNHGTSPESTFCWILLRTATIAFLCVSIWPPRAFLMTGVLGLSTVGTQTGLADDGHRGPEQLKSGIENPFNHIMIVIWELDSNSCFHTQMLHV